MISDPVLSPFRVVRVWEEAEVTGGIALHFVSSPADLSLQMIMVELHPSRRLSALAVAFDH